MKKVKKIISIVILFFAIATTLCVNASGVSYSYSLRQLSGVPSSSNVYTQSYVFTVVNTSTVVTCTQNTTTGADVIISSSNGIQAFLDTVGTTASAPSTPGTIIAVRATLNAPDTYNTYTGYGSING